MKLAEPIKPCINIPETLRKLADEFESGNFNSNTMTYIIGDSVGVLGIVDDAKAVERVIFDCTYAINKIMRIVDHAYSN